MPELPELPVIKDASVGTIRLAGTLKKRLPPMPGGATNDLSYTDARRLDAEQLMNDMRAAYGVSRSYDQRNSAVARARARQNDRQVTAGAKNAKHQQRKLQGHTVRKKKSTVLRNARDYLRMGTDLYR
jgi:hypothetical protein